jgi:phosphohistidine phosphatase
MPTLTLLRHAKAAQPGAGDSDFDRPLTERGRSEAAMAGRLLALGALDLALVSGARRTRQTWEIASRELPAPPAVSIEAELYSCSADALVARLTRLPPQAGNVLVIGHNPCMHEMAMYLASRIHDPGAYALRQRYPPAALATFRLDRDDWGRIVPAQAHLVRFATADRTL